MAATVIAISPRMLSADSDSSVTSTAPPVRASQMPLDRVPIVVNASVRCRRQWPNAASSITTARISSVRPMTISTSAKNIGAAYAIPMSLFGTDGDRPAPPIKSKEPAGKPLLRGRARPLGGLVRHGGRRGLRVADRGHRAAVSGGTRGAHDLLAVGDQPRVVLGGPLLRDLGAADDGLRVAPGNHPQPAQVGAQPLLGD